MMNVIKIGFTFAQQLTYPVIIEISVWQGSLTQQPYELLWQRHWQQILVFLFHAVDVIWWDFFLQCTRANNFSSSWYLHDLHVAWLYIYIYVILIVRTNSFMQNFPLEATQIASVLALIALICKILPPPPLPGPPATKALILWISTFVTKLKSLSQKELLLKVLR